jgi:hypothetical protein
LQPPGIAGDGIHARPRQESAPLISSDRLNFVKFQREFSAAAGLIAPPPQHPMLNRVSYHDWRCHSRDFIPNSSALDKKTILAFPPDRHRRNSLPLLEAVFEHFFFLTRSHQALLEMASTQGLVRNQRHEYLLIDGV